MGFLEDVVEATEAEVGRRRKAVPDAELRARFGPEQRGFPFSEALVAPGVSLVAEVKRASPSRGLIRPGASVTEIVRAYEAAGAGACSILTEPAFFGGSLDDLVEARAACGLPLLRKDFIIDEYQLLEARAAGADAVLLIVAALEGDRLSELLQAATDLRLEALVEVHDEDETQIAVEAGAEIIGVNNRDLRTLEVDPETALRLLPDIPAGTVVIAESGIATAEDVRRMGEAGVDAVLVGEALMRAPDPGEAVRALLAGAA